MFYIYLADFFPDMYKSCYMFYMYLVEDFFLDMYTLYLDFFLFYLNRYNYITMIKHEHVHFCIDKNSSDSRKTMLMKKGMLTL